MQKYFKRFPEWVKAWQYNGESREEMPEWVLELEKDHYHINDFTVNKFTSNMIFDGTVMKHTDWIVVAMEDTFLMSDATFRELYEIEGKE